MDKEERCQHCGRRKWGVEISGDPASLGRMNGLPVGKRLCLRCYDELTPDWPFLPKASMTDELREGMWPFITAFTVEEASRIVAYLDKECLNVVTFLRQAALEFMERHP